MSIINWAGAEIHILNTGRFVNQPQLSGSIPQLWLEAFKKNKLVLGLKGHYHAGEQRLEIHRWDSWDNVAYTEWQEWEDIYDNQTGWPITPNPPFMESREAAENGKWIEPDLDEFVETSINNEEFDKPLYINQVIDHLNFKLSFQNYEVIGWQPSDFNFTEAVFEENDFSVSSGDPRDSHSHTGSGEQKDLWWTLDTDMKNWSIIRKEGENNG